MKLMAMRKVRIQPLGLNWITKTSIALGISMRLNAAGVTNRGRSMLPSSSLRQLLEGRTLLPNLQYLVILFTEFYNRDTLEYIRTRPWWCDGYVEDRSQLLQIENKCNRLRYLRDLYDAIALNTSASNLEIDGWYPFGATSFYTQNWRSFLGRLETFRIKTAGESAGWLEEVAWYPLSNKGYRNEVGKMGMYFFDHLTRVKTLSFVASRGAPVGLKGEHHIPLPFKPDSLPALQKLELSIIFIGPELVEFIQNHKSLRTIILNDVYAASPRSMATNRLSWREFFDALRAADLGLKKFGLIGETKLCERTRQHEQADTGEHGAMDAGSEEDGDWVLRSERIWAVLKEDTGRRLFPYGGLVWPEGCVGEFPKDSVEAFEQGYDQAAYDKFKDRYGITEI